MKRKLTSSILLMAMLASLGACGGSSGNTDTSDTTDGDTTPEETTTSKYDTGLPIRDF